jgi:hypothetical protein
MNDGLASASRGPSGQLLAGHGRKLSGRWCRRLAEATGPGEGGAIWYEPQAVAPERDTDQHE